MAFLNRFKRATVGWATAGLAIAGVITSAAVWGDVSRPKPGTPVAAATIFGAEAPVADRHDPRPSPRLSIRL